MTKKQERHIIASVGTVLFMILLFLILWFMRLYSVKEAEQEGIEVAFNEEMFGTGNTVEKVSPAPASIGKSGASAEPVFSPSKSTPTEEQITADEETLAAAEKARKEKEKEEAERAKKAKEDEAKRKAADIAKWLNNAKGASSDEGNSNGSNGDKPNPVKGPGGNGRDERIQGLDGRNLRDGKLPTPDCKPSQPGTVAVKIRIDKDGNVKIASSSNAIGTNMGDPEFVHCIEQMLKQTKWTVGPGDAEGTIKYTFKQIDVN